MRIKELIYQTTLYKKRIRIVGNRCEDISGVEIDFHAAWSLVEDGALNGRCFAQPAQPYGLVVHNDALDKRSYWMERTVAKLIGAEIAPPNTKGYDMILPDGRTAQIKCARWYTDSTTNLRCFTLHKINNRSDFDVLIVALEDQTRPNDPSAFDFFVLELEDVRELTKGLSSQVALWENGTRFKRLKKYRYDVHGLRRAFDLTIEEAVGDYPQPVIDLYVKQPYDIIPHDPRYEAPDFYAEMLVAQLTDGVITEQKCPGYDVLMKDGTKISVKMSQLSHAAGGCYRYEFHDLYDKADYDLLAGVVWATRAGEDTSLDIRAANVILIPKLAAEALKEKGKYKRIRFTPTDQAPTFQKFKPFFFTLSHLVELREIGYAKFYEKYLRVPTEQALQRYAS